MFTRNALARLGLPFGVVVAACGGEPTIGEEKPAEVRSEQWQLADREYPFPMDSGSGRTVCAEWSRFDESTGTVVYQREWYYFDKMNDVLRGARDFDAGTRDAIITAGVTSVVDCEDARRFMKVQEEYLDGKGESIPDEPIQPEGEGRMDKVAEGHEFFIPQTVRVRPWAAGICTGVLVGPKALLTAAHCTNELGWTNINVDYGITQPGLCISAGGCNYTAGANATVTDHPNYLGTGDWANDLAIVLNYNGLANWSAPADTSSSWSRIIAEHPPLGAPFWIEGYGASHSADPPNWHVGRSSNQLEIISWADSVTWKSYVTSGLGRACMGDSGGPAHNFGLIGSGATSLVIGIFVSLTYPGYDPGYCPGVNGTSQWNRYTQMATKKAFIENTLGQCYEGTSNDISYLRCW